MLVKPRRYTLTLHTVDPKTLKVGASLGEIRSFTAGFAMNAIPTAVVEPPHGDCTTGSKNNSILNKLNIYDAVKERQMFGVVVNAAQKNKVRHGTTSDTNDNDTDYWPGTSVCIFKGYLISVIPSQSASKIATKMILQHWLSDLSRLTLYAPGYYGAHAFEVASRSMTLSNYAVTGRSAFTARVQNVSTCENIFDYFKTVCKYLLDDAKNTSANRIGAVNPEYIEATKAALDRIQFAKECDYSDTIKQHLATIKYVLNRTIGAELGSSWVNATAWNKLINQYLPMFLLSITPAVDKATVIPIPSVISKKEEEQISLSDDDILTVDMNIREFPVLRGVCSCGTARSSSDENADITKTYQVSHLYPPTVTGPVKQGGSIQVIELPSWLSYISPTSATCMQDYSNATTAAEIEAREKSIASEQTSAFTAIASKFTAQVFLLSVLNGNSISVTLPFRGDICPGSQIHITINDKDSKEHGSLEVYGTVEGVSLVASSADFHTIISLNNIRTKEEYEDKYINPDLEKDTSVSMFKKSWSGRTEKTYEVLYAKVNYKK